MAVVFAFVFVCILLYAISQWENGNKHKCALAYFFFVSNGFYVIPNKVIEGLPINKLTDFGVLIALYVFLRCFSSGFLRKYLRERKEMALFATLMLYLTLVFVWTVVFDIEEFKYSLTMYRTYAQYLGFVIFINMNYQQLMWLFKKVVTFTVIGTILFVLQPILGVKINAVGSIGLENGVLRYRNIPYLAYFLLIYATIKLEFRNFKIIALLFLTIVALILTQHRGIMIGYAACVAIYLISERQGKKMVQYSMVGLVAFALFGSMIMSRFSGDGRTNDTASDFKALLDLDYRNISYDDDGDGGTLTFRVVQILEKGNYLLSNPKYMLQGVGMRHEDSPRTSRDFNFYAASRKVDPRGGWYYQQLDSGDSAWATPLIKFGFVGIFLYILVTVKMAMYLFRNRKISALAMITFYHYLLLIFTSMKNNQLFDAINLFMVFLMYNIIVQQIKLQPKLESK